MYQPLIPIEDHLCIFAVIYHSLIVSLYGFVFCFIHNCLVICILFNKLFFLKEIVWYVT